MLNSINLPGILLHEKFTEDKRKKIKKYFVTVDKTSISPVLNYSNLNHFLLGLKASQKLKTK